jgi:hypothetical protein
MASTCLRCLKRFSGVPVLASVDEDDRFLLALLVEYLEGVEELLRILGGFRSTRSLLKTLARKSRRSCVTHLLIHGSGRDDRLADSQTLVISDSLRHHY